MAKKLSNIERQYAKELRRIKQFIRRTEDRGYTYPANIIPPKPKKITLKSVNRLQKITPDTLYHKATYTFPDTGEVISGTERKYQEVHREAPQRQRKITVPRNRIKVPIVKTRNNETEYKKQIRRVNNLINKFKKRGYEFGEDINTYDIEQLKKITAKSLYDRSIWHDPISGQTFPGNIGRDIENYRKKQAKENRARDSYYNNNPDIPHEEMGESPADENIEIFNTVMDIVDNWSPLPEWKLWFADLKRSDKNILRGMLYGAIYTEGRETVAKRLQRAGYYAIDLANNICYESGKGQNAAASRDEIQADLAAMAAFLKGGALDVEEARMLSDRMEYNLHYNDVGKR